MEHTSRVVIPLGASAENVCRAVLNDMVQMSSSLPAELKPISQTSFAPYLPDAFMPQSLAEKMTSLWSVCQNKSSQNVQDFQSNTAQIIEDFINSLVQDHGSVDSKHSSSIISKKKSDAASSLNQEELGDCRKPEDEHNDSFLPYMGHDNVPPSPPSSTGSSASLTSFSSQGFWFGNVMHVWSIANVLASSNFVCSYVLSFEIKVFSTQFLPPIVANLSKIQNEKTPAQQQRPSPSLPHFYDSWYDAPFVVLLVWLFALANNALIATSQRRRLAYSS